MIGEFQRRTDAQKIELLTSDEYAPYQGAILQAYGKRIIPPHGKARSSQEAFYAASPGSGYAPVHKTRRKGCVVEVEFRVIFGPEEDLKEALERSAVSTQVNTAFIERHTETDRNRNARKPRKRYCFSRDWGVPEAVPYFTMYSYNFCWPVRTLRQKDTPRWLARPDASYGCGVGRSCLVTPRMDHLSLRSTKLGHKVFFDRFEVIEVFQFLKPIYNRHEISARLLSDPLRQIHDPGEQRIGIAVPAQFQEQFRTLRDGVDSELTQIGDGGQQSAFLHGAAPIEFRNSAGA